MTSPSPHRSALVTGVSRRVGIAHTVARRLSDAGWAVGATGWPAHDECQPWGADPAGPPTDDLDWTAADLADPSAPQRLVDAHVGRHDALDALVACHARSSDGRLGALDAAELDLTFAINARATVLLAQAAIEAGATRVVLFTTGVHRGPMPEEIPYVLSKAAIQGVTATLAAAVASRGVTINCVNPGPVDTGYADEALRADVRRRMPRGRWGRPADIAPLVTWLLSDEAGWVTGQTIDADGGWGAGHEEHGAGAAGRRAGGVEPRTASRGRRAEDDEPRTTSRGRRAEDDEPRTTSRGTASEERPEAAT